MKNTLFLLLVLFGAFSSVLVQAQNEDERFYYYNGEKKPIIVNQNSLLVYYQSDNKQNVPVLDNYEIVQEIGLSPNICLRFVVFFRIISIPIEHFIPFSSK